MDVLVNSILNLTEECEGYAASAICKVGNDTIATASVVYAEAATKKNPTLTFNFSQHIQQLTWDCQHLCIVIHRILHYVIISQRKIPSTKIFNKLFTVI